MMGFMLPGRSGISNRFFQIKKEPKFLSIPLMNYSSVLFYCRHYCVECFRVVQGKVSKNFAVQADVFLGCFGNEFRIRHSKRANRCVDALDPDTAVNKFLVLPSAIGVGLAFFVNVFSNGPNVFAFSPISARALEDLFSARPGRYTVD